MAEKETDNTITLPEDQLKDSASRVTIDFKGNQMGDSSLSYQENVDDWVREQYKRANAHLARQGILFESLITEQSRYFAPHIAIWKIKDRQRKLYWVISGNVPTDAVEVKIANSAREAVRHFSLAWQLKADAILTNTSSDNTQIEYANLLVAKAEYLYDLHEKDDWWR